MRTGSVVALVAALLLGGCSALFDPASLDPMASAGGFCRALWDARYQRNVACDLWLPVYADARAGRERPDCEALQAAVTSGLRGYDRTQAKACLAGLRTATCAAPDPSGATACALAIQGRVLPRGACVRHDDCAVPGLCYYTSPGTCGGTCLTAADLGEPCGGSFPGCGPRLYCDPVLQTCVDALQVGQYCLANAECDPSLVCYNGQCAYPAPAGQPCGGGLRPCDTANDVYCAPTLKCQAMPTVGQGCPDGVCATGAVCASGTCQALPLPPQADGQTCAFPYSCGAGSYCATEDASPTCKAMVASGGCTNPSGCLSPASCIGLGPGSPPSPPGACLIPLAPGVACSATSAPCRRGSGCVPKGPGGSGICALQPDLGQVCGAIGVGGDWVNCMNGYCDPPAASVGTCRPEKPIGTACSDPNECASFACGASQTCEAGCPGP